MNFDLTIYETTVIPAIIFLLWVASQIGLTKKFFPLLALTLGIIAGVILVGLNPEGVVWYVNTKLDKFFKVALFHLAIVQFQTFLMLRQQFYF